MKTASLKDDLHVHYIVDGDVYAYTLARQPLAGTTVIETTGIGPRERMVRTILERYLELGGRLFVTIDQGPENEISGKTLDQLKTGKLTIEDLIF